MPTWTPDDWQDGYTNGEWLAIIALPAGALAAVVLMLILDAAGLL